MGHFTEYLSDDPHFPCNILEDNYVVHCYFFQSSRMVQLFGNDFDRLAQSCAGAPQVAHKVCFQSMGRDVGGVTRGNPERAIELCSYADGPDDRLGVCPRIRSWRRKPPRNNLLTVIWTLSWSN